MTLRRNVLAGTAASVWMALVGLAVVPLYIRFLGIEAYGIIGFFAATQTFLQLLDMGLAPAVNREMARYSATGKLQEGRQLMHTLAVVYWSIAALIALTVFFLAQPLSTHWLHSSRFRPDELTRDIRLMGLLIACRWPIALYQSALIGMQRLTISSAVGAAMTTLASIGSVAVLAFVSPTIEAFFSWQTIAALPHVLIMRWAAWRAIGRRTAGTFDLTILRAIWRFSAGMTGIAMTTVLLTQLDKILLARMISLSDFGRYTLAWTVAAGLYLLVTPVFNTLYPRFSALISQGDIAGLVSVYRNFTRLFCTLLFPAVMATVLVTEELLRLWTRNPTLSASVAPVAAVLILGTCLHGVMHLPYALQLASGLVELPLRISISLSLLFVPLIIILTSRFGVMGAAFAWLVLNVIYLPYGTWLTHRKLLPGLGWRWLLQDVGIPLTVTLLALAGVIAIRSLNQVPASNTVVLTSAILLFILAVTVNFILAPTLRNWLIAGRKNLANRLQNA